MSQADVTGLSGSDPVIDVFLCHASPDKAWVRHLAAQIESETFDGRPDGRRLRVFFDEWDIDGEDFLTRMNAGLKEARYVAVVLSPSMMSAPFATLEWHHTAAQDPLNRSRRLIPILYKDFDPISQTRLDLPAPFRVLNWIDFRGEQNFKRAFRQLIRRVRDLPPERGQRRRPLASLPSPAAPMAEYASGADPDPVEEVILGNLLPVRAFPTTVWSAETSVRGLRELFDHAPGAPVVVLREKRLYTFFDLTEADRELRALVNPATIRSDAVANWRDDPDRWRWVVTLLNGCIRRFVTDSFPIRFDARLQKFLFKPAPGEKDRHWRNSGAPGRTVAARKRRGDGDSYFWVHHAAEIAVQTLGDRFYLLLEPSYAFSLDGRRPVSAPWVGSLHRGWTARERNAAILRNIVFWADTLGRGRSEIEIPTGGAPLSVGATPALARTAVGIETDAVAIQTLLKRGRRDLDDAAALVESPE